ncbi:MAG: cell division protein FtsZ [Treponema sp.]|nr:cell division protein FtsZ [Treponema sp.]
MNVLSVREQPQVIPFKTQEASPETVVNTVSTITNGNLQKQIVQKVTASQTSIPAVIKVISAGGGGGNALNRMIDAEFSGVEFIAVNTDIQDLINKSKAEVKVQIGAKVTGGRGAGGKPEKGESAALEDQEALCEVLKGADMVFVTACLGGGTGTGSAHVIAKIAKNLGALTVGVVTMPFDFEGKYKMTLAEEGLKKLRAEVDTLIVIRSQNLLSIIKNTTTLDSAYLLADEILCQGVQGISELITKTGFQNTDFADVQTIMQGKGDAIMGIGIASGENRAQEAVENAIFNPLLVDTSIEGATGVLINIAGPDNITLVEVQNIIKTVKEKCDLNVHLIHGIRMDNNFDNSIQVTVIATGFQTAAVVEQKPAEVEKPKKAEIESECDIEEILNNYNKNLKRPDFLPQREIQNDLDIPPVIRNYGLKNDVKQNIDSSEY